MTLAEGKNIAIKGGITHLYPLRKIDSDSSQRQGKKIQAGELERKKRLLY